jgi:hypothetical protein
MNKPGWGLKVSMAALVLGVAATGVWFYRGSNPDATTAASADRALGVSDAPTAPTAETVTPTPAAATTAMATVDPPTTAASGAARLGATPQTATTAAVAKARVVAAKPPTKDSVTNQPPQEKPKGTTPARPAQRIDLGI